MTDPWQWWTRKHDNSPVFAMLFDGQNHAAVARIPRISVEPDMFAEVRFRIPPDNMPHYATTGDYITWSEGHVSVWNRSSFLNAHTLGRPKGRKLGSKDAGSPPA
jgi:hypothetical protein